MEIEDDTFEADDTVEDERPKFPILILAAGSSSRMGRSKQLLEIKGQPLLLQTVRVALACDTGEVIVVLGSGEQNHLDIIKTLPVKKVINHYWKSGIGSSIKTGLHHIVREFPEAKGVIILVCDQPELTSSHILSLVETFSRVGKSIIASAYDNTAGVPVLFSRSFFSNLLIIADDHGAKKLIEQFPDQVATVEFFGGEIDLDTFDDYNKYLEQK
ncbi:MAG: nucleotidyltransferase family protein [Chryseolinea sp.]